MTVEQTTAPTYTCTCDRDGTVQTIQGTANDAYVAGWSRVRYTAPPPAAKAGEPAPWFANEQVIDLCPTCSQLFVDFMTPTTRKT
jgi:hypothetical protein